MKLKAKTFESSSKILDKAQLATADLLHPAWLAGRRAHRQHRRRIPAHQVKRTFDTKLSLKHGWRTMHPASGTLSVASVVYKHNEAAASFHLLLQLKPPMEAAAGVETRHRKTQKEGKDAWSFLTPLKKFFRSYYSKEYLFFTTKHLQKICIPIFLFIIIIKKENELFCNLSTKKTQKSKKLRPDYRCNSVNQQKNSLHAPSSLQTWYEEDVGVWA